MLLTYLKFLIIIVIFINSFSANVANSEELHTYNNVVVFDKDVNSASIDELIIKLKSKTITRLHMESPGGSFIALSRFLAHIKYYPNMETYVKMSASSAAAVMWTTGKVRIASPTAIIMFHAVLLNGVPTSEVCKTSSFLSTTEGKQLIDDMLNKETINTNLIHQNIIIKLNPNIVDSDLILKKHCNFAIKLSNTLVQEVANNLNKDFIFVKKIMFSNFEKDTFFTGQQLYDMGIAHKLEN